MKNLINLCRKMFEVGCIGFGGGNALIPILENAFVDKKGWEKTLQELDKDVLVANVTPGALPVEIVGSLGRRAQGTKGMFIAPIMFTLPGIIGTFILMMLISGLKESTMNLVLVAAAGISAFICTLLIEYMVRVFQSARQEGKQRLFKVCILITAVTALISSGTLFKILGINQTPIFGISTLALLLAVFFWAIFVNTQHDVMHLGIGLLLTTFFIIGSGKNGLLTDSVIFTTIKILMIALAMLSMVRSVRESNTKLDVDVKSLSRDIMLWIAFALVLSFPSMILNPTLIEFPTRAFLSTLMSFGGGDAYLTIADGMFVDSGMISPEVFYGQIVTVVNVLPGSILCKSLFGIGFYIGNQIGGVGVGIALGLCGYACSVAASCGIFFLMYHLYDSLAVFDSFNFIRRWIRPIVVGLLIKVMLGLLNSNIALGDFSGRTSWEIIVFTVLLTVGNYQFRRKYRNMNLILIMVDVALAMSFMLI